MKKYDQFLNEATLNSDMLRSTHDMLMRIAEKFNADHTTSHKELFRLLADFYPEYITDRQNFKADVTRGEYLVLMFYSMLATNRICFGKMRDKLMEYYKNENRFADISKIAQCVEYGNLTDPSVLDDVYNIITVEDIVEYLHIIKRNSLKAFQDEAAVGKWLEQNKGLNITKPTIGEDFNSVDLKDTKKNYAFQVKSTQYKVDGNTITFSKYCRIYKKTRTGTTLSKFKAYFYCIVNGDNFVLINNANITSSTQDSVTVESNEKGSPKILIGTDLNSCRDGSYASYSDYSKIEQLLG